MPDQTEHAIFDGPAIGVRDFHCSGADGDGNVEVVDGTQLCLVRNGVFGYEARGREYIADANSVLMLREGLEYRTRHPNREPDTCTVFTLTESSIRELTGTPEDCSTASAVPWTVRPLDRDTFREHWRLVLEISADAGDPDRALSIEERAFRISAALLAPPPPEVARDRPARAATERAHREAVEHVKEIAALRLGDRMPLSDVAAQVGWSPFELSRVFRLRTGLPIHRYRRQLRLRTAFSRVTEGESAIGNLALDLGFSTHSHFTAAFRSEFGVTPSDLRDRASRPSPAASAWRTA
jgi:AraC-like DNA-binding protein